MEGQRKFWRKFWLEGLHDERERKEEKTYDGRKAMKKFKCKF